MSTSPEQSSGNSTQLNTPLNISRGLSDASMISNTSLGSGGESPPMAPILNHTLSPPQLNSVLGLSSSSTPNSPHLGNRPSSGNLVKGMKRKLLPRKHLSPQAHPPTVPEDSLDNGDNQAKRDLFMRMLKGWQIQPRKRRNFKRTKRRSDKQYHSDDGYTSDPGILREVRAFDNECPTQEDDDELETDNDPDVNESRRLSHSQEQQEERIAIKIQDLERKAEKIKRSLGEDDDTSIHDNDDDAESITDKSSQHRLTMRFSRGTVKSKSFSEHQKQKLEKIELQIKELKDGGNLDSRGARLRGRIEGGLKGMSLSGIKGRLTNAGGRFKKKRIHGAMQEAEEALDDEDEEDDIIDQSTDDVILETEEPDEIISILKLGLDDVRLISEECMEQNKRLKEELAEHNKRLGESLSLFVEKLEQERERGDRLEWQLNDITELHQHEVDELRTQLTQIEHTTTNKCQDLEDAVEDFHHKYDRLDEHINKIMDTNEEPKVNHMVRKPMARVLSLLLVLIAFVLKVVSILRKKPVSFLLIILLVIFLASFYHYELLHQWLYDRIFYDNIS